MEIIDKIGLGTWSFGGRAYGPLEDSEALSITRRAYERGIRFFDTAHVYGFGRSEELLGEALGDKADARFCTKLGYDFGSGKLVKRYDSEYLESALEISLRRLRRERVDLLLLHNPPVDVLENGDVFEWLESRRKLGDVLSWGISVYDSVRDAELALQAGAQALEARYSLFRRDVIDEFLSLYQGSNLLAVARWMEAYSPESIEEVRHSRPPTRDQP